MRKISLTSFWTAIALLFSHCSGVAQQIGGYTQVVNVSSYDPKERQCEGRAFNHNDVSALRANGSAALIARCGKGGVLDDKCAAFLASADRAGMLPGAYYRTVKGVSYISQADQYVNRMNQIVNSRKWNAPHVLLCADFDAKSSTSDMITFLDRVKARTGVDCVVYLENSEHLRVTLHHAPANVKARLQRSPYWCALYSNTGGACKAFPAPVTPMGLTQQYNTWRSWSLWQYGGVEWEGGRSRPKVYKGFSPYFGNMCCPVERNLFRGNTKQLLAFWSRHSISLR